jgi:hypothetical protein
VAGEGVRGFLLWLGAPLAWALHLGASYLLVGLACANGWTGVRPALAAVTVAFAAAAAWTGVLAWREWRRVAGRGRWEALVSEPGGHTPFLMLVGVLQAMVFAPLILIEAAPPLMLPPCGWP